MPRTRFITILLVIGTMNAFLGSLVRAGVERPGEESPVVVHPSAVPARPKSFAQDHEGRELTSFYHPQDAVVFAKLRPVARDGLPIDEATALLRDKTLNEKLFNKDFEGKMRGEYQGRVAPLEKRVNNPIWRPSVYQMQQYEDSRRGIVQWTTHELMEDQLKDFFAHGDKDSAAMQALATARSLSGGDPEEKPKAVAPAADAAKDPVRSHRTDLPPPAPAVAQEEVVPTKVKAKLNVLKQNGSIVFTNPVANTSLNGSRDDFSLNMNREFRKLTLKTKAEFGVRDECINLNVNKKVADHIYLDLDHYTYTGDKRGGNGEKVREQAKVNYSISF